MTLYKGSCSCNQWKVEIEVNKPLSDINPRICDCNYCQQNPTKIVSDSSMVANFMGDETTINKNGDQLANFYYCSDCNDLLAIGCQLHGQTRGALNSRLLVKASELSEAIKVQPRLLSAKEKLERWGDLWGVINGL